MQLTYLLTYDHCRDLRCVGPLHYALSIFIQAEIIRLVPLAPTVAILVQASYKALPVPDRVNPSFVIFDIWALSSEPHGNSEHQRDNRRRRTYTVAA